MTTYHWHEWRRFGGEPLIPSSPKAGGSQWLEKPHAAAELESLQKIAGVTGWNSVQGVTNTSCSLPISQG